MTDETIWNINRLVSEAISVYDAPILDYNFFGGEPFLVPKVLDRAIEILCRRVKDYNTMIFISTNGSFVLKKDRLELVVKLMETYQELFSMRISNTIWHQKYRSKHMETLLRNLAELLNYPYEDEKLVEKFGFEEVLYWFEDNPYGIFIDSELHGEGISHLNRLLKPHNVALPIGRAAKTGVFNSDFSENATCSISRGVQDIEQNELIFTVHWNGDIGPCCYGGGGVVANINEVRDFADYLERYKRFAEVFEKKIGNRATWSDCKQCRNINLRGGLKEWSIQQATNQ